jgi:uncharacterized protein
MTAGRIQRRGLAALGLATLVMFSVSREPAMANDPVKAMERTVTVSATGSVAADPDHVVISTGIATDGDTARDAMTKNTAAMSKMIEGLKTAGIAAKDIQTTAINVEPRYNAPRDGKPPSVIGYRVVNMVRILARDIKKFGEVLDQSITLGANQMGGISFEVSNAETLKDEARRQAMVNARRRAELYAQAAGAALGDVLTISEQLIGGGGPRPYAGARMMQAEAVPVEPGSQRLEVQVHVMWGLK